MRIRKALAVLGAVFLFGVFAASLAADETTKKGKESDKSKPAQDQPKSTDSKDQAKAGDHAKDGETAKGDKCDAPKFQKGEGDNSKKDGYLCEASKNCDKACNLWRKHKEPSNNYDEFVAKQGEWKEATTDDRRNFRYYCKCEEAK